MKLGDEAISLSFAVLAFMLSAVDRLRAPSEHSALAQNCNDDGGRRAVIESDREHSCNSASSSGLLRKLRNTGVVWKEQERSMHSIVLNIQNTVHPLTLPAFTGMNKHTYSGCIENWEIPYRVMFLHLISTSIRAVDDLQSN